MNATTYERRKIINRIDTELRTISSVKHTENSNYYRAIMQCIDNHGLYIGCKLTDEYNYNMTSKRNVYTLELEGVEIDNRLIINEYWLNDNVIEVHAYTS